MKETGSNVMTGMYALTHMAVDLACAFLVYAYVTGEERWYLWLLVYNFCAFAMQMPIGAAADFLDRNGCVAAGGCIGVLAGLGLGAAGYPAWAVVAAGLGNACFHVGGGIDVLNLSGGRAAPLGVFVAPGALGICLGGLMGKAESDAGVWIGLLMILSAAAVRAAAGRYGLWRRSGNAPVSFVPAGSVGDASVSVTLGSVGHAPASVTLGSVGHAPARGIRVRPLVAAGCFLAAVVLRSFSGMVQSFPWSGTMAESAWLLMAAVVLGKMSGGILGDLMGIRQAVLYSMGAAALGFLCLVYPVTGVMAVFCWNMSMPLTLWAVSRAFPGAKGFGFGLLTFGLFLGFCPVYLEGSRWQSGAGFWSGTVSSPVGMALMALVSLLLLRWGLRQVPE